MRVAARHGRAWVTYGPTSDGEDPQEWWQAVRRQAALLDAECERIGRDPSSIDRLVLVGLTLRWAQESLGAWDDFCGRAAAIGFTDVALHVPRPADPALPGPPVDVFDEVSDRLGR